MATSKASKYTLDGIDDEDTIMSDAGSGGGGLTESSLSTGPASRASAPGNDAGGGAGATAQALPAKLVVSAKDAAAMASGTGVIKASATKAAEAAGTLIKHAGTCYRWVGTGGIVSSHSISVSHVAVLRSSWKGPEAEEGDAEVA